jgi:hypothetical protein
MKKNWILVALAIALVLGFVYIMTPKDPKLAFIRNDIRQDHARFNPLQSIDIAMAMKLVTHEPPRMLNPPKEAPPLLLYPPSAEDLAKLSGN